MTGESQMIFEIWDAVRDFIPVGKRVEVAELILKAAADAGFEASELASVGDEDGDLEEAYHLVFEDSLDDLDVDE